MIKNNLCYLPCLRWKQGEYLAVENLSPRAKESIIPIIEVPELAFDFELHQIPKTLDKHLNAFTSRVKNKWGTKQECYVDLHHISLNEPFENCQYPTDFILNDLIEKKVKFIPVTRTIEDPLFELAILSHLSTTRKRLCIRASLDEFAEDDFEKIVEELLGKYKLIYENCDLILDLDAISFEPIDILVSLIIEVLKSKDKINKWNTFGVIGTSFPKSLAGVPEGLSLLPRHEWEFYILLCKGLQKEKLRIPCFGDYTINHPEILSVDPRFLKPKANIRYSITGNWLIARGLNVRDHKFEQFQQLCKHIVNSKHFYGYQFSYGDEYIYNCAQNKASSGNLSTWRKVGTNHHIELVVQDLANLAFF